MQPLSDLTPGGYGPQSPIPTVVVDFFQNHFGPVGVPETGITALFLLLGIAAVVVPLGAIKRRQSRRTAPIYLRFFGQSGRDTRYRVSGPPIEQKHPNLES
jgi:hypothetical protein